MFRDLTIAIHFRYCPKTEPNVDGQIDWRKIRELSDPHSTHSFTHSGEPIRGNETYHTQFGPVQQITLLAHRFVRPFGGRKKLAYHFSLGNAHRRRRRVYRFG